MSADQVAIVISFDDPECGGAADALSQQLHAALEGGTQFSIKHVPVAGGGSHRDGIYTALQSLYAVRHDGIFVIACVKDSAPQEFCRVREMCAGARPRIGNVHVLTHLAAYADVGLTLRNMVRWVSTKRPQPGTIPA